MASHGKSPQQEDQYWEAKVYDAIKVEDQQIASQLSMEQAVGSTQPAYIVVEHISHGSGLAKTSEASQNEPVSSAHKSQDDGNDEIHQDETNEKVRNEKNSKNLQGNEQKYAPTQSLYRHQRERRGQGDGVSHVVIKTETNPDLVESDQKDRNTHIAISEKTNPALLEFDKGNSNSYFVIKTEITEDDYTFLETNDSHSRFCEEPTLSQSCDGCGKKFTKTSSFLTHKRICRESVQELTSNLQQVDIIKTEELHIESFLPAVKEHVTHPEAPSEFIETHQGSPSSGIATKLCRDDCALPKVVSRSSTAVRASSAPSKIYCDECGQSFTQVHALKRHIKVIHKRSTQTCEQCGMEFALYSIGKHRKVCSGPTFFSASCEECGKKFPQTSGLLKHQQLCHRSVQEFNNDLTVAEKQVDEIKTEELHIESSLPVVEENVSSINTTPSSSDADQRSTSSAIATELSTDDRTLPDVITSNVERPSPDVSKVYSVHKKPTRRCERCGYEYCPKAIYRHRLKCKGPVLLSVSCDECGEKFKKTLSLLKHRKVSHGITDAASPTTCNECGKSFSGADALRRHRIVHHRGLTQTCKKCDHEFTEYSIGNHRRSCKGKISFSVSCDKCGKKFTSTAQLLLHQKVGHEVTKAPLPLPRSLTPAAPEVQCDECGRICVSAKSLKTHKKIAHEGLKRQCKQCGKEYNIYTIRSHLRSCKRTTPSQHIEYLHPAVEEFFAKLNELSTSTETDQGTMVTELSRDNCALLGVVNSSSTVKLPGEGSTRKCDHCGNEYTLKAIHRHERSCKGPVSFSVSCDECGKNFRRTASLLIHRKVSHGITEPLSPATCDECGQTFTRLASLRRHLKDTHKSFAGTQSSNGVVREEVISDLQVAEGQVHAITIEELNVKSSISTVKHEASIETDRETNSSSIVSELSQNDWELPEAVNSSSIVEQPNFIASKASKHCDECGQHFTLASSLTRHINVTHKGSTRTCEQCGNEYTQNTIRRHRRTCKGSTVSAACHECGKKFSKTSSLFAHQQVCHGVEPEFNGDLQAAEEHVFIIKTENVNNESLLPSVDRVASDLYAPAAPTGTTG